jgi:hypothetical protein
MVGLKRLQAYQAVRNYRKRIKRLRVVPEPEPLRYDASQVDGFVASWDFSVADNRVPPDANAISFIHPRGGIAGPMLASEVGGGTVPVKLEELACAYFTGGNGGYRFNAQDGVADNLFAGGGSVFMALRNGPSVPGSFSVLVAKWNGTGWILFTENTSGLVLELYHPNGSASHRFLGNTSGEWYVFEMHWDSLSPSIPPSVRFNGSPSIVTPVYDSAPVAFDDNAARLSVGNRDWGSQATPWMGDIGEVALFESVLSDEQTTTIRNDFMSHWVNP